MIKVTNFFFFLYFFSFCQEHILPYYAYLLYAYFLKKCILTISKKVLQIFFFISYILSFCLSISSLTLIVICRSLSLSFSLSFFCLSPSLVAFLISLSPFFLFVLSVFLCLLFLSQPFVLFFLSLSLSISLFYVFFSSFVLFFLSLSLSISLFYVSFSLSLSLYRLSTEGCVEGGLAFLYFLSGYLTFVYISYTIS